MYNENPWGDHITIRDVERSTGRKIEDNTGIYGLKYYPREKGKKRGRPKKQN